LIRREETGHKWIYYQLTEKGESLVRPRIPIQFVLVLSISLLIITAGFVYVNYYAGSNVALAPTAKGYEPSRLGQSTSAMTTEANITNQTNTTNSTLPK
jgi:hypothetical protein